MSDTLNTDRRRGPDAVVALIVVEGSEEAAEEDFDELGFLAKWVHMADYWRVTESGSRDERSTESWLHQSKPVLIALAERYIDHDTARRLAVATSHWGAAIPDVEALRGRIENADLIARIREGAGPAISAANLHDRVWAVARSPWDGRHYRHAVLNAATAVEQMAQEKSALELTGSALYQQIFSLDAPAAEHPRLRFYDAGAEGTESWKSRHLGAMTLGQACAWGIRNWAAHTLDEADEQTALEYLATLSVLARWIDQAHRKDDE